MNITLLSLQPTIYFPRILKYKCLADVGKGEVSPVLLFIKTQELKDTSELNKTSVEEN